MTRVISIVSGKGGVGKTTVCINLAAALSLKFQKKVMVIDCNITTSHIGLYLGMYYHPITFNQVLKGEASVMDAAYEYMDNLMVIPSSLSVKDLKGVDIGMIKNRIKELYGKVDFVLLDSAPGLGREASAVLRASDEVLFVTNSYLSSVIDILRCKETIRSDFMNTEPIGIVLNMSSRKDELRKDDIEEMLNLPVIEIVPLDKKIPKSLVLKKPVVVSNPSSRVGKRFYRLAKKIVEKDYKLEKGFFDKFKDVVGTF